MAEKKDFVEELTVVLPKILKDISKPTSIWWEQTAQTNLVRSYTKYVESVAKDKVDPKKTHFWKSFTTTRRRSDIETQVASCIFYLGFNPLNIEDKISFLDNFQETLLGNTPHLDKERDAILDRYGVQLLEGYNEYKDVIHMSFDNPYYTREEDVIEQNKVVQVKPREANEYDLYREHDHDDH